MIFFIEQSYKMNMDKFEFKKIKNIITNLIEKNELRIAKEIVNEFLETDFQNECLPILGIINMMEGNLELAEEYFIQALKFDANNFDLNFNLAYLYKIVGNYDLALDYYDQAILLANTDEERAEVKNELLSIQMIISSLEDQKIKKVLFIQSVPCIRTNKVAKALKKKGIIVDILYLEIHPADVYKNLDLPYSNIFKLDDVNKTMDFINTSDYDILYSSNEPDYLTVLFSSSNKPIIHDTHDMMSLRSEITPEQLVLEYSANVNSSGNIYVNSGIRDVAMSRFKLKNKPILTLHSYIEEEQLPTKFLKKLSELDNEIHAVFEGGIHFQEDHHRFLEPIIMRLVNANIHVHLYGPVDPNYIKLLVSKSKYLHYEGVFSPRELIIELTKYDMGLAIFNLNEKNRLFLDTAFPNKIWDYLAAEIPIIFADLKSFKEFSDEYGVGEVLSTKEDLYHQFTRVKALKIEKDFLVKNKLTMNTAASEIVKFLEDVKDKYYVSNCDTESKEVIEKEIRKEKNSAYYNDVYKTGGWNQTYFKHYSQTPYYDIWLKAIELLNDIQDINILDVGCGPGQFANMLFDNGMTQYKGFDFSLEAINSAKLRNSEMASLFSVDNVYTTDLFGSAYNTVVIFELLEHIDDDLTVLSRIRSNTNILFSVPNFVSEGHVRWFSNSSEVLDRYSNIVEVDKILTFSITERNVIYLVSGRIK